MANKEQLAILKQGVEVWNAWRDENLSVSVDLRDAQLEGAFLKGAHLSYADLVNANLKGAYLREAHLWNIDAWEADFSEANLMNAKIWEAKLHNANFSEADLSTAKLQGAYLNEAIFRKSTLIKTNLSSTHLARANFSDANLNEAVLIGAGLNSTDFTRADLSGAYLVNAVMVETKFHKSKLCNCRIYGISAWNVFLEEAIQSNLIITNHDEPEITVDNLEIAQFIYLLLHNEKLRDVIDTVGKKAVLILGRFSEERKAVLDAIRDELRQRDYIPILFDFEKPSSRDVTETVSTLAHMARFVIADLTDAKSIPQELAQIVPHLPSVAVQPLILQGQREYGMFEHWQRYGWVLPIHVYENQAGLIAELGEKVIAPAEAKVDALRQK